LDYGNGGIFVKRLRFVGVLGGAAAMTAASLVALGGPAARAYVSSASKPSCAELSFCAEVANPKEAFGSYYVGHDEPSVEFNSNIPGAGTHMQYQVTIPSDPTGAFSQSKGYNFELHPAFWFGVDICDTYSYPEQLNSCTPGSDSNIIDPTKTYKAPGGAFEELQFYPPGFVRQFAGFSCDPTKWCVALNIDSLSENPINGTTLNTTCQHQLLGGIEYINFAYLTLDGKPLGPPNPLQFDPSTSGDPTTGGGRDTLFLNQGDKATVTLTDSPNGLVTTVKDVTTGQTGTMTASAANGFGHIKYAPTGTACTMVPYNFHPMYSTSSPKTRVFWTAHSYNVAFSDEIGHFDFCSHINPNSPGASCDGKEGIPGDREVADGDDNACFSSSQTLLYKTNGCLDTNSPGFDGVSYQHYWPNGSATNPTSVEFSSPLTSSGPGYYSRYGNYAFETDLPRIEAADLGGICDRNTGSGCTNPPPTDDGNPATFYPYFSQITPTGATTGCAWGLGETLPNTLNNFGGSSQEFGPLYKLTYWVFGGRGATTQRFNDYNSGSQKNTC
jgi:hypothetical protein